MLKQFLQLKLSQKLSPQQIQLMKLIELPLQELEDRLSREIEENPALETGKENEKDLYETESDYEQEPKNEDSELNVEDYLSDDDIPDYKLKTNNYSDDDEEKSLPFVSGISFNEFLKKQLTPFNLNEDDSKIAEFLVGSVDQSGYIRSDIVDIEREMTIELDNIRNESRDREMLLRNQLEQALSRLGEESTLRKEILDGVIALSVL